MRSLVKKHSYTLLLAGLVFVLSLIYSINLNNDGKQSYQSVTVQSGDTLWKIADQYKTEDLTKVEFIDWIEKHNDIYSRTLKPGDNIIIPVTKGELVSNLASEQ
ncbi:LysM peptidoglycan-binding domain-containing protein [Bacillus sp. MUM 13]|uniref:cell division suppressor protein YneA n=1 Tax=Bacillus sp. MUM 13 TaxID=1678001 RepID=UPI0008F5BA1C|nr:LysM peptidoglycan-binding domain-containing protein [Bacillus sp. MUM 13]OIK13172.1 hypothetical protein BIV59_06470 [Bacillus sp. MUM 13]